MTRTHSATVSLALSWRAALKREYVALVESQVRFAEEWTRGHMLRPESRYTDVFSLFYGPEKRAMIHASDELKEFWRTQCPRVTFEEYEQWKVDEFLGEYPGVLPV